MMLDLAPLSTQQNQLTDALNATFLTYNGNEGILQNDMGNTKIQDANTGNIMGLREGFVPIGMKEHGGVLYIASVNKEGEGEIGTIPSPIIRDFLKEKESIDYSNSINQVEGTIGKKLTGLYGTGNDAIRISNKLYPGEKFIMSLSILDKDQKDAYSKFRTQQCCLLTDLTPYYIKYPYISNSDSDTFDTDRCTLNSAGLYSIKLFTQTKSGIVTVSDSILSEQTFKEKNSDAIDCNKWFLNNNPTESETSKSGYAKGHKWYNIDLRGMTIAKLIKTYPSTTQPGYLCIKAELNSKYIKDFNILPRTDGLQVPYTIKWYTGDKDFVYRTYFPGFWYTSDTAMYLKKLKITVYNETDKEYFQIYNIPSDESKTTLEISIDELTNGATVTKTNITKSYKYDFDKISTICNLLETQPTSKTRTYIITNCYDVKSSTTVKNATSATVKKNESASAGGLFYIELGSDCNKWCNLQVQFENQFGEEIGTYFTKFNPYLNDTFGTNDIPVLQLGAPLSMNISGIIESDVLNIDPRPVKFSGTKNAASQIKYYNLSTAILDPNVQDEWDKQSAQSLLNIAVQKTTPAATLQLTCSNSRFSIPYEFKNREYTNYDGDVKANVTEILTINKLSSTLKNSADTKKLKCALATLKDTYLDWPDDGLKSGSSRYVQLSLGPIFYMKSSSKKTFQTYTNLDQLYATTFANFNCLSGAEGDSTRTDRTCTSYDQTISCTQEGECTFKNTRTFTIRCLPNNSDSYSWSIRTFTAGVFINYCIANLYEETPKSFDYIHYKECKGPSISLNATGTLDVSYTVPEAKFRATNKFIPYINHYINLESETKQILPASFLIYNQSQKQTFKPCYFSNALSANLTYYNTDNVKTYKYGSYEYQKKDIIKHVEYSNLSGWYILNIVGDPTKLTVTMGQDGKTTTLNESHLRLGYKNYCIAQVIYLPQDSNIKIDNDVDGMYIRTVTGVALIPLQGSSDPKKNYTITDNSETEIKCYKIDYFNKLITDKKITVERDNATISELMLPIATCYKESFYNTTTNKTENFYIASTEIRETLYLPNPEYVFYSFESLPKQNTDNSKPIIWYYQPSGTDKNSLNTVKLRIFPGTPETNGNITYSFNQLWGKL